MEEANEVTGRVYKQFNRVEYYFHLKETNDSLVKANERLINALAQNFEIPDSTKKLFSDTIKLDTVPSSPVFCSLALMLLCKCSKLITTA